MKDLVMKRPTKQLNFLLYTKNIANIAAYADVATYGQIASFAYIECYAYIAGYAGWTKL